MSLTNCLGKLTSGKNTNALSPEDRQVLHRRVAELVQQGTDRTAAEKTAVQELVQQAQDNHDHFKSEIQKEMDATGTAKKAPAAPDNAAPETPATETPQVLSRAIKDRTIPEKIAKWTGYTGSSLEDWFGNKMLGKAYSVLRKMREASGEMGAYSKTVEGRVSASLANWQSNNAMTTVSNGLNKGYIQITKAGDVIAVDNVHNIGTLKNAYKDLRAKLEAQGFKEVEADSADHMTIDNAIAHALFGPRLKELEKIGQFAKGTYTKESEAFSEKLRADKDLRESIDKFHDTYNVLRGKALDAMVESGLYTKEDAQKLMDRGEYLPLYRMDEKLQEVQGASSYVNSLLGAAKEYHLGEGNELSIGDPLTNVFKNLTWLNMRAIKNNTANLFGEALQSVGAAKFSKVGDIHKENVVAFNRNGEKVFLHLEDKNDVSAFTSTPVMTGLGWNIARLFTSGLRKGITSMPGFVWGQLFQDAQRVSALTGQGHIAAIKDIAHSVVNTVRGAEHEPKEIDVLRKHGVVAARDFVDSFDNFKKEMLDQPESQWYHFMSHLEKLSTASDAASRVAAFKHAHESAIGRGLSETEAQLEGAHAARQLIDFNNRGNSRTLAMLMTAVPFVNARIQGTARVYDALRGRVPGFTPEEAQWMAMKSMGKMAAFTLAYTAYQMGNPEYEQETKQVRDGNFMLGPFKVPVANEFQVMKSAAEVSMRQLLNDPNEDWHKSKDSITHALTQMLMGPSDMIPTAVKPFVEAATNHDFSTGHSLVPQSMEKLSSDKQYMTSTTEPFKALSGAISPIVGISPIVMEHFLTAWTGRMGQEALNLTRTAESAAGTRAAPKINEVPFIGSAFTNPEGNAMRADFEDVVKAVQNAQADLKQLQTQQKGPEIAQFMKENQPILSLAGRITPIEQRLTALKKQLQQGEPSAEKRDRIYAQQLEVLKQVGELRKIASPWL